MGSPSNRCIARSSWKIRGLQIKWLMTRVLAFTLSKIRWTSEGSVIIGKHLANWKWTCLQGAGSNVNCIVALLFPNGSLNPCSSQYYRDKLLYLDSELKNVRPYAFRIHQFAPDDFRRGKRDRFLSVHKFVKLALFQYAIVNQVTQRRSQQPDLVVLFKANVTIIKFGKICEEKEFEHLDDCNGACRLDGLLYSCTW